MASEYIIIGSGLGGLVCGAILSLEGRQVCVLEKDPSPGGLLRTFSFGGERFSTGMHYAGGLDEGMCLNRYLKYLGIAGKLQLKRLDEDGFDRIFTNGRSYPLAMGAEKFVGALLPYFPDQSEALRSFVRTVEQVADAFPMYHLKTRRSGSKEDLYRSLSAFATVNQMTADPVLRQVLTGNRFLYAGHPDHTPLHQLGLILHSFFSGAYRFVGGSDQITRLLSEVITREGGTILCDREVKRFGRREDLFEVTTTSGEVFHSFRIISAIHPATTIRMAEPGLFRPVFTRRISSLANTGSVFSVFARLKPDTFPYLNYNACGFSGSQAWPESYLLMTPADSDEQHFARTLEIHSPMNWEETEPWVKTRSGQRGPAYAEFRERRAEELISLASKQFPGLRSWIDSYTAATPLTWSHYTGSPEGSLYGIRKEYQDPVGTMIHPATKAQGFYFTGQNVNIHGMLGTVISAFMTAGEIIGLKYLLNKVSHA